MCFNFYLKDFYAIYFHHVSLSPFSPNPPYLASYTSCSISVSVSPLPVPVRLLLSLPLPLSFLLKDTKKVTKKSKQTGVVR